MGQSEEDRKARLAGTRQSAAAFVEDLDHVRKTLAEAPADAGGLRRLSNVLRRLLVNREVQDVAAPRIGRFNIDARDKKPVIKHAEGMPLLFYASAGGTLRYQDGNHVSFGDILAVNAPTLAAPKGSDPDKRIPLRVDNFLSQRVFFIRGKWITRNQVIKYVANIGSGVHSGVPQSEDEKIIASIRRSARFSTREAISPTGTPLQPIVEFNLDAFNPGDFKFEYSKTTIDPLLLEMLATAECLSESTDSEKLRTEIVKELGS